MREVTHSLLAVVMFTTVLFAQGPHHFQPGFNLFSKDQDMQLGTESAAQVRKQMTVINDPVLTNYVNLVGKRLANSQEARDSGFPFTFEVVADPSINAFALPGGPMFINTGLLKAVDSEAQLAACDGTRNVPRHPAPRHQSGIQGSTAAAARCLGIADRR